MSSHSLRTAASSVFLLVLAGCLDAAELQLVDIKEVDPTIVVDLRYASARNLAQRPLYPPNMPALLRVGVAECLAKAQENLRQRGYSLKIWDAYRPKAAHDQLWQITRNTDYVADPAAGGSLHSWGVAVDATLVDTSGRDVQMPTDFDDFTPAAWLRYIGNDDRIRHNLWALQGAMGKAGFYGLRTEWWHFVVKDWQHYRAVDETTFSLQAPGMKAVSPAAPHSPSHLPSTPFRR